MSQILHRKQRPSTCSSMLLAMYNLRLTQAGPMKATCCPPAAWAGPPHGQWAREAPRQLRAAPIGSACAEEKAAWGRGSYLPVAEHQLRAGQATRPLPDFVSEAEAFGHRQRGLDDEHVCPLLHLFPQHSAFPLRQDGVDAACKATRFFSLLPGSASEPHSIVVITTPWNRLLRRNSVPGHLGLQQHGDLSSV